MTNQWPKFDMPPKTNSVRSVLLEEGNGISERTNNRLQFLIESDGFAGRGFVHCCSLLVPKIDYRYPLLRVIQENLDYPVTLVADLWSQGVSVSNETDLRKNLGLLFRSEAVTKLVPQLIELIS